MAVASHPISEVWGTIDSWLQQNVPVLHHSLQGGATEREISHVEALLGIEFPEDIRMSFRIHNGQTKDLTAGTFGLFGTYEYLSLEQVVQIWQQWENLANEGEFVGASALPLGPVCPDWWNSKWVPFTANDGGDSHCVDLVPQAGGTMGQVIHVLHDDPQRVVEAKSFFEWLNTFAVALLAGQYGFSEELGGLVPIEDL